MIKNAQRIVLLSLLVAIGVIQTSFGCTNFLISKGATVDGSTMITYAADSHTLYGELYYQPALDYPEGAMRDIVEWDTGKFLGRIPQIAHTNSTIGNMNEFQVAIGETTLPGQSGNRGHAAGGGDFPDRVIAGVGDIEIAIRGDGNSAGRIELRLEAADRL